jgi:hypothetical protein
MPDGKRTGTEEEVRAYNLCWNLPDCTQVSMNSNPVNGRAAQCT